MCQSLQLKPGEAMKTMDAVLRATGGHHFYGGFARGDRMAEGGVWYWKQYGIVEVIQIKIHGFGERDHKSQLTKREYKESERQFERDDSIVIIVCERDPVHNDKGTYARIVTRPSTEDVAKVHDREPLLWNRDKEIWNEIFGEAPQAA